MPRKKHKPNAPKQTRRARASLPRSTGPSTGRKIRRYETKEPIRRSSSLLPQAVQSRAATPPKDAAWLYGVQPVLEALRGPERRIEKIWIAYGRSGRPTQKILALAREQKIPVSSLDRNRLEQKAGTPKHQGVLALVTQIPIMDLDTFLDRASPHGHRFFALLDGIQDPHNLGAIMRTACATGMDGLLLPSRRVCPITPSVMKTSAGAGEWLPLVRTENASRALEQIRESGAYLLGADPEAGKKIYETDFCQDLCLVIGGEGKGLRPGLKRFCDDTVRIPMKGPIGSLNVSVASAILFYEVFRQRSLQSPGI